jgi:hypothetical protein
MDSNSKSSRKSVTRSLLKNFATQSTKKSISPFLIQGHDEPQKTTQSEAARQEHHRTEPLQSKMLIDEPQFQTKNLSP